MSMETYQATAISFADSLAYMSTLADRIAALLAETGLSQSELARQTGIKQPSVAGWLSGKTKKIEGANLLRAADALGVMPEWLATGEGPKRQADAAVGIPLRDLEAKAFAAIPLYSTRGSCGLGYANDSVEKLEDRHFPKAWLPRGISDERNLCFITAHGDSMSPGIQDGEEVMIDRGDRMPANGCIYAVQLDDEVVIKRVQRAFGMLTLQSDNPDKSRFRDIMVPANAELIVIGKVVWRGGGIF